MFRKSGSPALLALAASTNVVSSAGTALSPYAAALKHVAVRGGRAALASTAREEELRMARAGALPADYRPPPTTAWDDTIERWAYAWQFPVAETAPSQSQLIALEHPDALRRIIAIAKRLHLEPPPSKLPNPEAVAARKLEQSRNLGEDAEQQQIAAGSDTNATAAAPPVSPSPPLLPVIPAAEYAALLPPDVRLPAAYIDDGSAFSAVCRELGTIMVDELGLPFDETGLRSVLAAVAKRSGSPRNALALLRFVLDAGFSATPALYSATMLGFALRGQAQPCHDLIEEMKERGITPDRSNWETLMIAYSTAGDHGAVLQIVDNMKSYANIEPDERTFASQLFALSKDQSRESNAFEAVTVFDQMENVYGFVPNRTLYHALMACLCRRAHDATLRQRLNDTAAKMELVGIPWNNTTYMYLLQACSSAGGDVQRCRELCAKMRNEGLTPNVSHLAAVIRVYGVALRERCAQLHKQGLERGDGDTPAGRARVAALVQHHSRTVLGIVKIVDERRRRQGPAVFRESVYFIDSALAFHCTAVEVLSQYAPDNGELLTKFEESAKHIWNTAYEDGTANATASRSRRASGDDDRDDDAGEELDPDLERDNRGLSFAQRRGLGRERFEGEEGFDAAALPPPLLLKTATSYDAFISMFAAQQRIDEAENLFQEMVYAQGQQQQQQGGLRPRRSTYEKLILMHLVSGEEGAAHRALGYMDAMTKAGMPVRPGFLKRMQKASDEAAYRRDMKRRARRIMQAREEYLARKAAEEHTGAHAQQQREQQQGENAEHQQQQQQQQAKERGAAVSKDLVERGSTLASIAPFHPSNRAGPDTLGEVSTWWKHWELSTVSKHELFDRERADGTPAGEEFAEKNAALRMLGIESKFLTKGDLPRSTIDGRPQSLSARIRADGSEPAHALWNLGGESGAEKLPSGFNAKSTGWGATLWRERQILRKELEAIRDGVASPASIVRAGEISAAGGSSNSNSASASPLSSAGNALRTAPEQLAIERSGAKTFGELQDAQDEQFSALVYEDGTAKPASEFAAPVSFAGETVWQAELRDELAPFKSTAELYPSYVTDSSESAAAAATSAGRGVDADEENVFMRDLGRESRLKAEQVAASIRRGTEQEDEVQGTLAHRKRSTPRNPTRTDFLHKWRQLYRQGVLEMKDEPIWDTRDPATNRANAMRAALETRKRK